MNACVAREGTRGQVGMWTRDASETREGTRGISLRGVGRRWTEATCLTSSLNYF